MSDAAPVLSLRGIARTYRSGDRQLEVLKSIDLDLYPGELVGLIGPSGSGKSSLLHAAGLLERPTAGQVLIGGQDCTDMSEKARTQVRLNQIGFVYQFHHLLAEFSARDNVALPQMIAGVRQPEARQRADELLSHLGLGERLNHQPAQLSGGEQQRVAIARALINDPGILYADEPTGNLDASTGSVVMDMLMSVVEESKKTLVVVTHDQNLAKRGDRRLILKQGALVEG